MRTYTYPEALHLLVEDGERLALQNTISAWHIECVQPDSVISTIPVLVRVNNDGSRAPWPPNTNDILNGEYVLVSGDEPDVNFRDGSSAKAFDLLIARTPVRRTDWKGGMYIRRVGDEFHIVLPNGKELQAEFHPDFFDITGAWEVYTP